jgi:hypothetical protein
VSDDDDLFAWGLGPDPRHTDPDTSHAAARMYKRLRSADRQRALIIHSRRPGGLTDFELGAAMMRQQTSAGKRRGELRDMGLIEDSGLRRPAPSRASAIVWRITAYGRLWTEKILAGELRSKSKKRGN